MRGVRLARAAVDDGAPPLSAPRDPRPGASSSAAAATWSCSFSARSSGSRSRRSPISSSRPWARPRSTCSTTLPGELGFDGQPSWWPIPLAGAQRPPRRLTIRYLPGTAGHKPAEGFKTGGAVQPIELPGIILAAFATLSLGVVLGPEAPLIAIGSGMGVLAVHLIKRDAPEMASVVIGAAGSFAAIATLLGSPLAGAFLLMEAGGLGGALMGVVLVPGLLAAGIGSLIYVGLDDWTGFGTFSLAVPDIPAGRAARRGPSSSGRSRSACSPRLPALASGASRSRSSRSSSGECSS